MKISAALFLTILVASCGTTQDKEKARSNQSSLLPFTGIYAAETNFGTAKQWDTLQVRKADATDSFIIYYSSRYNRPATADYPAKSGASHDTFPGVYNKALGALMLGPAYSMKEMSPPPVRAMHIDTMQEQASFCGIEYKKLR